MTNPGYGDVVYVDSSAPATAEIIFRLIKSEGLPLDRDIAENLYAAISTDTGSFQYPKTSAHTFEIAAELIRTGLDVGRLSQLLYENYPRRRLELLRELLRIMRFQQEGHVASFSLSLKTAAELGVLPEDNEGLIDHLRSVRGVIVAVFRRTVRGQSTRKHAFQNRGRRCLRHLPEIRRRRSYACRRCARAWKAAGSRSTSLSRSLR